MLGLEPRDRRCFAVRASEQLHLGHPFCRTLAVHSCRADQFQTLPWPNTRGIRLLSGTMRVEIPPAAPLPGSVKAARRFVKPDGVGASPTLAANFWKAGRYKLAAPVPKTGSVFSEVGALPTPSATSCSSKAEHSPDKRENAERYRAGRPAWSCPMMAVRKDPE